MKNVEIRAVHCEGNLQKKLKFLASGIPNYLAYDQVTEAFKIMLRNPDLKAILVNIFGGIMRCDVVAEGLVQAAEVVKLKIPLVVRLEGTNVERGREILEKSGLDMITATTMADAAEKVVAATGN